MKIRDSFYYTPYEVLEKKGISFADFAKKKNYYTQLAFLFELGSSRNKFTKKEVEFVKKTALKYIPEPQSFLDLACGTGRHARILSAEGYNVTGIDASKYLLREARKKDAKTFYKEGDLRTFTVNKKFDCIFSMWEAYNYLSRPNDLKSFFVHCSQQLKKGGILILDCSNFWKDGKQPELKERNFTLGDYQINLVIKQRNIWKDKVHEGIFAYFLYNKKTGKANVVTDQELVKIYSPQDIRIYQLNGLKLKEVVGNFGGGKYQKKISPRLIYIFQKI